MNALTEAFTQPGTGALYWCGMEGAEVPSAITTLIQAARNAGRLAYYVHGLGFDDMMMRLARHCLTGPIAERARTIAAASEASAELPRAPFALPELPPGRLIKSNAFEIACPPEVLAFELSEWPETRVWRWLEERTSGHDVIAVPSRGKVLALGTVTGVQQAFVGCIKGAIDRTPLSDDDLRLGDGAVVALLKRALIRSLARTNGLDTDGRDLLWDKVAQETRKHEGHTYRVHESARLFLRRMGATSYLVVKPSLRIVGEHGEEISKETARAIRMSILGWQHNAEFNQAMRRWRTRLFPRDRSTFEFPPECGSTFRFDIRRIPVFAQVAARRGRPPIRVASHVPRW